MHSLQFRMLGPFQARRGALTIEANAWGRRKNVQLLKYFLAHRGQPLTQEQLLEAIYPEQPTTKSARNLLGRISELRRILEPNLEHGNSSSFILRVGQGTYMFTDDESCLVDIEEFVRHINAGSNHFEHGDMEAALRECSRAVELYRGEFLAEDPYEEWTLIPRERFHAQYIDALLRIAQSHLALRSYERAARGFLRVIHVDPIEERAHRGRMMALYHLGERRQALEVYEECVRTLKEQGLEPDDESLALFRSIDEQKLPQESEITWHNLPKATTPFFGRTEEIHELLRELNEPSNRVVTLLGPGGIGKSRLALEVARQSLHTYKDGVFHVDVGRNATAKQMLSAIVASVEIPLQERQDLRQQVLNALQRKEILLIIDNAEHAIEATDVLEDIVQETDVQLLAASRQRLHITSELIVEVQGLDYYDGDWQHVDVRALQSFHATQLFVDRMHRVNHRFALTQAVASDVARICRAAQGMPLAIELAASWGRAASCREIADGIEQNLRHLEALSPQAPSEHRSVRAIFEHTWSLLSADEQRLFAKLSVFHGGVSSHSALHVTQTSLSTLMSLRDKALLQRAPSDRYVMHELLRQFAEERLNLDSDLRNETHDAHALHFSQSVADCAMALRGPEQIETLDRLQADSDNLRAAWNWNVDQHHFDRLERMLDAYYRYHELRNNWYSLEVLLSRAIDALRPFAAESVCPTATQDPSHPLHRLFASLLSRLGTVHFHLASYTESQELLEESLTMARHLKARWLEAQSLCALGTTVSTVGEIEKSAPYLQESVRIAREIGDAHEVARCVSKLGILSRLRRQFDEAERHFKECLETYQRLGDPTETAGALLNLGTIYGSRGEATEAERLFQESLRLARQVGHRILTFMNTGNIGYLAYMREDYATAIAMYQESWAVALEIGNREGLVFLCYYLCLANARLGKVADAERYIQYGFEEFAGAGSSSLNPATRLRLGAPRPSPRAQR